MTEVVWCNGMTLKDLEKKVILKALAFHQGNKTKVAAELGVSIRTVDNKLKLYSITEKSQKDEK